MNLLFDLLNLLFPNLCVCCKRPLLPSDVVVCLSCMFSLPMTNSQIDENSEVAKSFWGRVEFELALSCFYYSKGGKVQELIHALKYRGRRDVGIFLGEYYGSLLKGSDYLADIDIIVPVPLHWRKKWKRGFNQSEQIAIGLQNKTGIPICSNLLVRKKYSTTQTRKSRIKRWENVSTAFSLKKQERFHNIHFLLVDDVITTGATIEACGSLLLSIPDCRISILSIGFTKR